MTSTTETEKSLSRRVAERIGWIVDGVRYDSASVMMLVYNPKGEIVYKRNHILSESSDTSDLERIWIWALRDNIPDYEHDLNAAVRDCRMAGYRLVLRLQEGIRCFACYEKKIDIKHWEAIIETMQTSDENNPAEAVCLAFEALCVVVEGE